MIDAEPAEPTTAPLPARALAVLRTDEMARWTFRASMLVACAVFYGVGRKQWFIRDDWAVLITRVKIRESGSLARSLFVAQDGHWMTVPVVVYEAVEGLFGLDSYWPFLIVCLAAHVGIVLAVRAICRRVGVTEWTATLVCAALLVLGSGWENIVFAVQITYNLSLLAFLAQLLLVDHDGPADRRDALGAVLAVLGVASSGFGPFFVGGIALFLAIRRRWVPLAIGLGPAVVASAWWWITYGSDRVADERGRPLSRLPEFVRVGLTSVFEALTPLATLVGIAMLATTAVIVWRGRDRAAHDLLVAMAATLLAMLIGVGFQRVGFGAESAASSRYVYVGAMLIAPAFAIAVDQLRRLGRPVMAAAWLVLAGATAVQAGELYRSGSDWAQISLAERRQLEVFASVELPAEFDLSQACLEFSPDVRCGDVARLVAAGAVAPAEPATDQEHQFVERLLETGRVPLATP